MEERSISVSLLLLFLLGLQCEPCYGNISSTLSLIPFPLGLCCSFVTFICCFWCCFRMFKQPQRVTVPRPVALANPPSPVRTRSNSTPERETNDISYIFIPVAVDTNMTNTAPPCVVNTTENDNFLVTEEPNLILPPTYDEALEYLQDTEGND